MSKPSLKSKSFSARETRGAAAHKSGMNAESWAVLILRMKFYRILGTRLRTPFGEVDILAQKGRALVAVEVKTRTRMDEAYQAISMPQRQRLIKAAQHLAGRQRSRFTSIRCDAMLFGQGGWPKHIKNAFEE